MGFPFLPSDMVVRREWFDKAGLFDETLVHFSEDLEIYCRFAQYGCRFGGVDRALNYRRHHSGRSLRIGPRLESAILVLDRVFEDPRCSEDVRSLRNVAKSRHYLIWSVCAFAQTETSMGQDLLKQAVKLDPDLLRDQPCRLVRRILRHSVADVTSDHSDFLRKILAQFPPELSYLAKDLDWAIAQGYLMQGARAVIWQRPEDGKSHFDRAGRLRIKGDNELVASIAEQLISLEREYGSARASEALCNLQSQLVRIGTPQTARALRSLYYFNQALGKHRTTRYRDVLLHFVRAVLANPRFFGNRGLWAVLFRNISALVHPSHQIVYSRNPISHVDRRQN